MIFGPISRSKFTGCMRGQCPNSNSQVCIYYPPVTKLRIHFRNLATLSGPMIIPSKLSLVLCIEPEGKRDRVFDREGRRGVVGDGGGSIFVRFGEEGDLS